MEGEEFSLALPESWKELTPVGGNIIEVYLPATDYPLPPDAWAGFLVLRSELTDNNSVMSLCKFVGTTVGSVAKDLSNKFNRRTSWIHFCRTRPCIEFDDRIGLHATQVKWWTSEGFTSDYMTPSIRRQIKTWIKKAESEFEPPAATIPSEAYPKSAAKPAPGELPFNVFGTAPVFQEPELPADPGEPDGPEPFTEEEKAELARRQAEAAEAKGHPASNREQLRERLRALRERVIPGAGGLPKRTELSQPGIGLGAMPMPAGLPPWDSTQMRTAANLGPRVEAGVPGLPWRI